MSWLRSLRSSGIAVQQSVIFTSGTAFWSPLPVESRTFQLADSHLLSTSHSARCLLRCGDTDNGFGPLFNWNLLRDGEHTVVACVDGVELGQATVRVTTLGQEFLRGAEGEVSGRGLPPPGAECAIGVAAG